MEQQLSEGEEVVIVGGGNSAGQAAMFLSRTVSHVHILVRGAGLAATMSDYLVRRIESSSKITLHPFTEITALAGDTILREVTWTNRKTGASQTRRIGDGVRDDRRRAEHRVAGRLPRIWMRADSSSQGAMKKVTRSIRHTQRLRPGSLRSATCGPGRSSAWLPAWAKVRLWCRQSTGFLSPGVGVARSQAPARACRTDKDPPPVPPGQMS